MDDQARGGDLDLYIELDPGARTLEKELDLEERLDRVLDGLKVDLVFHERGRKRRPIAAIAHRDGLAL